MERREFVKSLEQYYREKGKHPPPQNARLAGKPVSLHLLFERVTKLGGSYVLSNEDRWQDILQAFSLSPPSASLAYGLRKIYKDYLESFEKLQLYGEEPADIEEEKPFNPLDEISEPRRKKDEDGDFQSFRGRRSMSQRPQYTADYSYRSIYRPEPPEWRLINSLRSCLPNEVNFILNTLLLYCSDHHKGKRLRLERCPHLLDILMLHAGCPKREDEQLYARWKENSRLLLVEYWEDKLTCDALKPLLGLNTAQHHDGGFTSGETDREGQRIRHILVIIRNICQDQHDVHFVRRSESVFKFLLRCSFINNDIGLVEQALETISIILQVDKADKSLEPPVWSSDPYASLLIELIGRLVARNDKMVLVRTLEIYTSLLEQTIVDENPLLENHVNQSQLASFLADKIPDISDRIVPFLTLPDCELVIATLEALNALAKSPLGVALLNNDNISLLVDLLSFSSRNCDIAGSRFYGPRLQEITHQPLVVVPRITRRTMPMPPPNQHHYHQQNHHQPQQQRPPHLQPPPHNQLHHVQHQHQHSPQQKPLPPKRPINSISDDQSSTQTHAVHFCKKFLTSRVELTEDTALIPRSGMFLEYQAMARQDGQKSGVSGIPILTIPEFTRLIREMFPTSQLINDAQGRQVYSGIKMRPKPVEGGKKLVIKQNGGANGAVNGTEHPAPPFKVANGRPVNGVSNDEEDSNHSQQSLDSVGGMKPAHLAAKDPIKDEPGNKEQAVKDKPLENGINGKHGDITMEVQVKGDEETADVKTETRGERGDQVTNGTEPETKQLPVTKVVVTSSNPSQPVPPPPPTTSSAAATTSGTASSSGPSAGLRVLLQNAGSFIFDDFTDDREDCLTRSIRIQSALVLLALVQKSVLPVVTPSPRKKTRMDEDEAEDTEKHLAVELLLRHEHRISLIAASRQDASPVLARLLSYLP